MNQVELIVTFSPVSPELRLGANATVVVQPHWKSIWLLSNRCQTKSDCVKKHLPGCSGPGASSAYCGFPQRRAAPISSANQKVQVCLPERRRFCQYEILVLSTSCRRRLSKTAPNLDRHQFNSNQVLLAASESASIWPHHPSLQNCSRVSPSECFQASLKNSINIVIILTIITFITITTIIFFTKLKLSGVGKR